MRLLLSSNTCKLILGFCAISLAFWSGRRLCQTQHFFRNRLATILQVDFKSIKNEDALPSSTINTDQSTALKSPNGGFILPPANYTYPLSCARFLEDINSLPDRAGSILCRLQFTELFQAAVIRESLLIVDTKNQPFDGYLWHRCVVFGRFENVVTQHLDEFHGNGNYDRSLLMVRGKFVHEWKRFKSLTKKSPGILLWADEKCESGANMSEAKYSFRHYGCLKDTTSTYIPNGFWRWKFGEAPSLGARENQIRADSSCNGMSDVLKASERRHFFNWQGNIRRNRRSMVSSAQKQYKTSNEADARYYLSPRGNGFDGDQASFQDAVENSAFTLCPCGNNAETHRLWEALLAGSIPVQEDCADTKSQAKFLAFVKKVLPDVIFIKDWDHLHLLLYRYEKDKAGLDQKQKLLYVSFIKLMFRIGMNSGGIVIGDVDKITWPNGADSA
jgi:hypothetical protein